MAANHRRVGGLRHVRPSRASLAAVRTARPVPRAAGRHGATRQPGLDGLSILAGEIAAHRADRLPQREHHHPRGRHEHGIATIWDADVLIWAASQIVSTRRGHSPVALDTRHALRDPALHRARHILNDYLRLKAALDRLQSTSVATSIRETTGRRLHRFRGSTSGREPADASGTPLGIELILPDWFYAACLDAALVLTIDPAYFRLKGASNAGCTAWYASTAGGRNTAGNSTSGTLPQVGQRGPLLGLRSDDLRALVARQSLPGYVPGIERMPDDNTELLTSDLPPTARDNCGKTCDWPRAIRSTGYRAIRSTPIVLSGVRKRRKANNGAGLRSSNLPNKKYITFSRSASFRWTTTKRHGQAGFPAGRAAP